MTFLDQIDPEGASERKAKEIPQEIGPWSLYHRPGGAKCGYYTVSVNAATLQVAWVDAPKPSWAASYFTKRRFIQISHYKKASQAHRALCDLLEQLGIWLPADVKGDCFLDAEIDGDL